MLPPECLAEIKQIFKDPQWSQDETKLKMHATDYSYHEGHNPDILVYPRSIEQVIALAKVCNKYRVPIVPYGSGTSLEGHTIPTSGGVTLSMKFFNKLIAIHDKDHDVVCQPGLGFITLNRELEKKGFFFPCDAGPNATVGGMVSTNASGTRAFRYGPMRQNVLQLTVVLPSGEVIKTRSRARKTSAGYDLTSLFAGSEGTLGIICEITLKIYPIFQSCASLLMDFPSVENAANLVIDLFHQPLQLAMLELLDGPMMKAVNIKSKLSYPERPTLYLEIIGTDTQIQDQRKIVANIASKYQDAASKTHVETEKEAREELFKIRKAAFFAAQALREGDVMTTDVAVPLSSLALCIAETAKDIVQTGLVAPLVGHVGDGNFHLLIVFDSKNKEELEKVKAFSARLVNRALAMDGTCTGEHGVGNGKMSYLQQELGDGALNLMRTLKRAIDPNNIMNPDKIFFEDPNNNNNAIKSKL